MEVLRLSRRTVAGLYSRVSTDEQARHGVSLAAQQESMESFCRAQHWHVHDRYVDEGYSGKDLNRPAMQRLIGDVKARRLDVLLVWKLDRLSRRQFDILHLIENVLTPHGVGFKSVTESFDTTTPWGKAAMSMMAVFAQLERETIVERTRLGLQKVVESGRWKGGRVTFGYDYTPMRQGGDGVLRINDEQAEVVRLIFALYTDKKIGMDKIASYLNGENEFARKYPTPRGGRHWTGSTVRQILMNPVYTGRLSSNGELVSSKHDAIIDTQIWEEAQVERQRRRTWRPGRVYMLSGLLRCDVCGATLSGSRQWTNWPRRPKRYSHNYVCQNRRSTTNRANTKPCDAQYHNGEALERKVINALEQLVMDGKSVQEALKTEISDPEDDALSHRLTTLNRTISEHQRALERYYRAFEDGALAIEDAAERIQNLQGAIRQAARERDDLQEQVRECSVQTARAIQRAGQILQSFGPLLRAVSEEEIRLVLNNLVSEIRVGKSGEIVLIKWK